MVVAEAVMVVVAVTDVPVMVALSAGLVKVVAAADAVPEVAATRTTTVLMDVTAVTIRRITARVFIDLALRVTST